MDDLTSFLKNTAKALETHTVIELNEALTSFLKNKTQDKNSVGVNEVLEIVCSNYGISKRTLLKSTARGKVQVARKITYCLLHHKLGLPARYISKRIFDKWPNSISIAIQYYNKLDPNNKVDREFIDTYEKLKQQIIITPTT